MVEWSNAFQALPGDADAANQGANAIRTFKDACNERFELEMNFRAGTKPFIKAGIASVINVNATATIAALASPSNGGLAFDSTTKDVKYYGAAEWHVMNINHANLSNMTSGNPHTQYLPLAGGTMTGNLVMGSGNTVDGVDVGALSALYVATAAAYVAHAANNVAHANQLGAWAVNDATATGFAFDANYTALTDGFVCAYALATYLAIKTGTGAATTTRVTANAASAISLGLTCPVRKGDIWSVRATDETAPMDIFWLPIGS